MKIIFMTLAALYCITSTSQAAPYSCHGRELKAGGQGQLGHVSFDFANLQATWSVMGQQSIEWISENNICGLETEGADCFTRDNSMSRTVSKSVYCRKSGSDVTFATFQIVASHVTLNGRMTCTTPTVQRVVEFSNCDVRQP